MMVLSQDAWFAGFADGEGSFVISRSHLGLAPAFQLALRLDDAPILSELRGVFGGTLAVTQKSGETSKPQCHWRVSSKRELAGLVRYFDTYPLRAKKQRDYVIWREAVSVYCRGSCRAPELETLRAALIESRVYEVIASPPETKHEQLRVIEGGA